MRLSQVLLLPTDVIKGKLKRSSGELSVPAGQWQSNGQPCRRKQPWVLLRALNCYSHRKHNWHGLHDPGIYYLIGKRATELGLSNLCEWVSDISKDQVLALFGLCQKKRWMLALSSGQSCYADKFEVPTFTHGYALRKKIDLGIITQTHHRVFMLQPWRELWVIRNELHEVKAPRRKGHLSDAT